MLLPHRPILSRLSSNSSGGTTASRRELTIRMRRPCLALCTLLAAASLAASASEVGRAEPDACVQVFVRKAEDLRRRHQALIESASDTGPKVLQGLGQHDQAIRALIRQARQACSSASTDEAIGSVLQLMHLIDGSNQRLLRSVLQSQGWPSSAVWGAEVADAAFLIVQHADQDPSLQEQGLALLEPLVNSGEAPGDEFALLFDRIRVNANKPQRYGTQGRCQGKSWKPLRLENAAGVDALRAAVGLSPLAEYAAVASQLGCQH